MKRIVGLMMLAGLAVTSCNSNDDVVVPVDNSVATAAGIRPVKLTETYGNQLRQLQLLVMD